MTARICNNPIDDRNRNPVHLSEIALEWGFTYDDILRIDKAHHPNRVFLRSGDFIEVAPTDFIIVDRES